jgi:drug/metabolite transporter (DMT)-like permease
MCYKKHEGFMMTVEDFALGIACTLGGTAINSIGILLQKLEVNRSGMKDDTNMSYFAKRPLWVFGILCQTLLFAPFFFIGISFLGIALAQPLATAGLLVFVIGAVLLLKERLARFEWIGVILMIASIFLVSASGVSGDVTIGVFFGNAFLISCILVLALVAGLACLGILGIKKGGAWLIKGYAALIGTVYACVSISGQLVTIGFDAILTPATELAGWLLIVLGIGGIVIGTIFGILFSQRAFQHGKALSIVPISQAINNILPIVAGVYVFGQSIAFLYIFVPGVVILLASVILLARFQH